MTARNGHLECDHRAGAHDRSRGGPHPDCALCQRAEQPRIDALAVIADELSAWLRRRIAVELDRAVLVLRQEALMLQIVIEDRTKGRSKSGR